MEQPFEAPTEHLYVLSVMLSRDGGDPGVKSDWPTPVGRVTFQVRDGSQILVAISAVAMNNTPTSVMTNVGVQQGRMYKLRVINDDPTARLGMYLTVNERAPGAIVKTGPTSEARTYRQQLAATIRALY